MFEYNIDIKNNENPSNGSYVEKPFKVVYCVDCGKEMQVPLAYHVKEPRCEDCRIKHKKEKDLEWRAKRKEEQKNSSEQFFTGPFICKYCGEEFEEDWRGYESRKKSPPEFCSKSCQGKYASTFNKTSYRKEFCIDCGKEIEVNSHDSRSEYLCEDCIKKKRNEQSKNTLNKINLKINASERVNEYYYISTFEGPFNCKYCGKEFFYDYRNSSSLRHKEPPQFCSLACSNSYKSDLLKKGNKQYWENVSSNIIEKPTKTVKCNSCGTIFNTSSFKKEPYLCSTCLYLETHFKEDFLIIYHYYMKLPLNEENYYYKFYKDFFKEKHLSFSCFVLLKPFEYNIWDAFNKFRENQKLKNYKTLQNQFFDKKLQSREFLKEPLFFNFLESSYFKEKSINLQKLGFNFESKDSAFQEYLKVKKVFEEKYIKKEMSLLQFARSFGINYTLPSSYFYIFGIPTRNYEEAYIKRKFWKRSEEYKTPNNPSFNFKRGYHISWENKKFYLMSSYEFNFAKILDEFQISYEVGTLILPYFSSIENRIVKGKPDFIFKDLKVIIETKSERFYNYIDLRERQAEANKRGFQFFVYLNEKIFLKDFLPINEIDFSKTSIKNSFKEIENLLGQSFKDILYF